MTHHSTTSTTETRIKHEIQKIAAAYRDPLPPEHPLTLTVALLRLLGFNVRSFGEHWARIYEKNFGIDNGPHIWIGSHLSHQEAWDMDGVELARLELREREKLVNLLGEFYANHTCSTQVRLIVQHMAAGSGMLNCQGAEVMGLPENESRRGQWLASAYREMQDFTDFLYQKLDQGQQDSAGA